MNRVLIVDTETSDLNDKRIVQLAAVLVMDGKEVACLNTLIKPDGWTIDPKAQAVHGISLEDCSRGGVGIAEALWLFDSLARQADVIAAHNLRFDSGVLRGEYRRLGQDYPEVEGYCTMENSRSHCQIPPTARMIASGRRGWKSPSLKEAHFWATGRDFENAHDALADCRAALVVYEKLQLLQTS